MLKNLGAIAGIGGISLGVFLQIYKSVLHKVKLPGLSKEQAYKIIRLVLILTWGIAALGIFAYIYSKNTDSHSDLNTPEQLRVVKDSTFN